MIEKTSPPPKIEFPNVPDPEGEVEVIEDYVKVTIDYWIRLAEYMVDVDAVRQKYETQLETLGDE